MMGKAGTSAITGHAGPKTVFWDGFVITFAMVRLR